MIQEMKVLNIAQPNAHYIFHSGKNIENRGSIVSFRGTVLIYASKTVKTARFEDSKIEPEDCVLGAIIGSVDIVDCITESELSAKTKKWFMGPYGYVLENPVLFKNPIYVKPPQGAVIWWSYNGFEINKIIKEIGKKKIKPIQKSSKVLKNKPKNSSRSKLTPTKLLAKVIGEEELTYKKAIESLMGYMNTSKGLVYDKKTQIIKDPILNKITKNKKLTMQQLVDWVKENLESR